jgi:hypothetical protein
MSRRTKDQSWRKMTLICVTVLGCTGTGTGVASAGAATREVFCSPGANGRLQSAINAASSGDALRLHGVCTGNFDVPGAGSATRLTLQGVGAAGLSGAGHGTTLLIHHGASASVAGLQINGGGNVFEGGGISVFSATLNLSDSTVSGNRACTGAGVAVVDSTATITNTHIRGNSAGDNAIACDYVSGGGLEIEQGSTLTMVGSAVSGNSSAGGGVGGGLDVFGATATLVGSAVRGNSADWNGGGISAQYGSVLKLRSSLVSANAAVQNGGGGIVIDGATAFVTSSTIDHNTVRKAGAGILQFSDTADPANGVTGNSRLTVKDSRIADNTATREGGGGIANFAFNYANGPFGADGTVATVDLTGVVIGGNQGVSSTGGGLWNAAAPGGTAAASLTATRITANTATLGGGIGNQRFEDPDHLGSLARVSLGPNTLVTANTALTTGGGLININGADFSIARGAIVRGNHPNDCTGC